MRFTASLIALPCIAEIPDSNRALLYLTEQRGPELAEISA
jgi:hypothetical protein